MVLLVWLTLISLKKKMEKEELCMSNSSLGYFLLVYHPDFVGLVSKF